MWIEFFKEQAGLDVAIVLIFVARILEKLAGDFVVKNLADRDVRINSYRLYGKHLQCPVSAKAHVSKTACGVDEDTEAGNAAAAFDHRHQIVRFGALDGPCQIELIGIDYLKNKDNYEIDLIFNNNAHISLKSEMIEVRLEDLNEIDND